MRTKQTISLKQGHVLPGRSAGWSGTPKVCLSQGLPELDHGGGGGPVRAVRTGPPRATLGAGGGHGRLATPEQGGPRASLGAPGPPPSFRPHPDSPSPGDPEAWSRLSLPSRLRGAFPETWAQFWRPDAPFALRAPGPGGRAQARDEGAGEGEGAGSRRQPGPDGCPFTAA